MTRDTFMFLVTNRVTLNNPNNLYLHCTNHQVAYHGSFFTSMSSLASTYTQYTLEKYGFCIASEDIYALCWFQFSSTPSRHFVPRIIASPSFRHPSKINWTPLICTHKPWKNTYSTPVSPHRFSFGVEDTEWPKCVANQHSSIIIWCGLGLCHSASFPVNCFTFI